MLASVNSSLAGRGTSCMQLGSNPAPASPPMPIYVPVAAKSGSAAGYRVYHTMVPVSSGSVSPSYLYPSSGGSLLVALSGPTAVPKMRQTSYPEAALSCSPPSSLSSCASASSSPSPSPPPPARSPSPTAAPLRPRPACSMERTKLSAKQIRHALPEWMVTEVVDLCSTKSGAIGNGAKRSRRRSRASDRSERGSKTAGSRTGQRSGVGSLTVQQEAMVASPQSRQLLLAIAALPTDLQKCFSDWRRERWQAIAAGDVMRQQQIEGIMASALAGLQKRQTHAALTSTVSTDDEE